MIGSYKLNFKNLSKVMIWKSYHFHIIHKTENAGKTTKRPGDGKPLEGSTNDRQVRFFLLFLQAGSDELDIVFSTFY